MKSQQDTQNVDSESSPPFYAEVQQLASDHNLGPRCSSYAQSTTSGTRVLVNAIVWFAVSLLGLFFLIDALRKIPLQSTLSDPPTLRSIGAIGVISLVVLFGCFLQGWRNLREYQYHQREQVHIFEDGFVCLEGRNHAYALRWDEIESLMRGTLDPKHPQRVSRDNLSFMTDKDIVIIFEPKVQQRMQLCDEIEQAYTDYRRPGMLELYNLGEDLEFGNLILNEEGITHIHPNNEEEDMLAWDEIAHIEVGPTYTRITSQLKGATPWFEELTADVDNALILKELLSILHNETV
ncbi:DUF6585 family protein [Dictyobacter arantiisoli]|uniref:Uncharacterized protein n=1 Tax=Dictyobacter arantiisoli TaxID=2014874 RepID=A0A5A5TEX8_9CHLR|nr:DUF6585 family protein [Dictyobacter arantiisoli]GCF09569.1 hypothetical protein KDI_31330 [Dictyobacter arantiisoli]